MKKSATRITAAVTVLLLFFCTGCSLNFFSVESLLSPPSLTGKNGEIQAAFEKLMNSKTIQLKTPAKGNYQSSFVSFDIDSDGVDEVLVFYSDQSIDNSARMSVLDFVNDTWVIAADIKGSGSGVYDVDFADLGSDSVYEVFINWSLFDSKNTRILTVYSAGQSATGVFTLNPIMTENCSAKSFSDFNADGRTDLVLIYLDDSAETQNTYLRVFSEKEDNTLVKYGEVLLDSSITSVSSIKHDMTKTDSGTLTRLFIDCLKSDAAMITEVVYWSAAKKTPVRAFKTPAEDTLRNPKIFCRDIDSDGLLEVPSTVVFPGDARELSINVMNVPYTFSLLKWKDGTGDGLRRELYTVYNPLHGYLFLFPWSGKITVMYDAYRNALAFCEWDSEENVIRDELFAISFNEGSDEAFSTDGLTLVHENDAGSYYASITEYGADFGITQQIITDSLIIL